jgi:hypothetical protein
MPPKKKKKIQKPNVENILKKMELDLMLAGKIPGEEGSSIVGAMQARKKLAEMPQSGAITALMPISPLDLAFETFATGLAHSKNVDPRLAILGSIAAARYGPSTARAVNVKGGGYLSQRAYKKGMESVKKDPMFADIDYAKEVRFIKAGEPLTKEVAGRYIPQHGINRRHYELYPHQMPKDVQEPLLASKMFHQPSIELAERTLFESFGNLFNRKWAESTLRHESRHYKQHLEGMKRKEVELGSAGFYGKGRDPKLEYGYPADWYTSYSTLIDIPAPRWKWPMINKKYIDKKTGNPKKPSEVNEMIKLEHGEKAAKRYAEWYKKKVEKKIKSESFKTETKKDYYRRPIEVEARIEEISALGDKPYLAQSFRDLKFGAGYSTKQILDMVTEYRIAKKKYNPSKYKAQPYEPLKVAEDLWDEYK